jgi:predicted permease
MINPRLALRTLFRTPFVTLVAIVSLALGIGANAAIFSLFNQILLRSLSVQDPQRLVNLVAPGPKSGSTSCGQAGDCDSVFSYPMFHDLEQAQNVFTGIAAHRPFGASLAYRKETASGDGLLVSGGYFAVLGLKPALGRLLEPGDATTPGEAHAVVLNYDYWRTRFDASPSVLNDTLVVNGEQMTVVGVAPRGFDSTTLGLKPRVYVPITMRDAMERFMSAADNPSLRNRRSYWVYLFARLKPGVSVEQAGAALNVEYSGILNDVEAPLQKGMSAKTMKEFRAKRIRLEPGAQGQTTVRREAREPLMLLLGVTGLVLLIACANIANLLLARAATRSNEMAVRLSIGAGRLQLAAQLLTESLLLALLGGAAGILVANWTLDLIVALMPAEGGPANLPMQMDGTAFLFAAGLAITTGVLFGLFPALHSTRPDLVSALKGQAGQPGGGRAAKWFRAALATAQIALSMALLVAAGLFVKSLVNVSRVDLGFNTKKVVMFGIAPQLNGYSGERSAALFERLQEDLAALPGVSSVSGAMVPLLAGSRWGSSVEVEGFKADPDTNTVALFNEVEPAYFSTLGIPLLSGREFGRADASGATKVAVVNEAFAKKFNLGRAAVGKHIGTGAEGKLDTEIVGLAQDAKYSGVKEETIAQFFRPARQDTSLGFLTFYVRTRLDPEPLLATIPRIVARQDSNLPVDNLMTLPQQVRENVFLDRLITTLSTAFAALATLLAAIGLYGVLAYTVAQRTREIGLRMALGAAPRNVLRMVLRQVAWMTVIGGVIGLLAATLLGKGAESLLFQLKGFDAFVFAASAIGLATVALAAGLVPAMKASRIDPMRALRYE